MGLNPDYLLKSFLLYQNMCFSNLRRENRILEKKLAEEKQLFKEEQEKNADNKAEALMVRIFYLLLFFFISIDFYLSLLSFFIYFLRLECTKIRWKANN